MYSAIIVLCFVTFGSLSALEDENYPFSEERGFGVGLVYKPKSCRRLTKRGDHIAVRFNATYHDGSTYTPPNDKPMVFTIGDNQVIAGWDLGLRGMCVNEIRHLTVPSPVAYGNWPAGDKVPPKSTIEFFVELLQIRDTFSERDIVSDRFAEIDTNGDRMLSNKEVATYLRRAKYPDGTGEKSHSHLIKEIFMEEDKDSDGLISHNEFSGTKKHRTEL